MSEFIQPDSTTRCSARRRNAPSHSARSVLRWLAGLIFVAAVLSPAPATTAAICPFCSAVNLTLTEQIKGKDVTVFARMIELPTPVEDPDIDDLPKATFEITQVIKGSRYVEPGMQFRALIVGAYSVGQDFMVMGINPPTVKWTMPTKASPELIDYVNQLADLPEKGADRLYFFQQYFEHEQSILAFDAYDEFASCDYEDMIDLKPRMDRDKLVQWIKDPEILINRRRLYLTMLGICGNDTDDVEMLEGFLRSNDRRDRAGLDALAACYLTLYGERGVPLLEELFLANEEAEYGDTTAIISSLRFIGTETDHVPVDRIVQALRYCLERPKVADVVIADLARWEDWSVMDRLVTLFKESDDDRNWVRTPVITYLRACPKPEAKQYIEELRLIDPDAVRRADFFIEFADDEFSDIGEDWADDDDIDDLDDIADLDENGEDIEPGSNGGNGDDGNGDDGNNDREDGGSSNESDPEGADSGSGLQAGKTVPVDPASATFTSISVENASARSTVEQTGSAPADNTNSGADSRVEPVMPVDNSETVTVADNRPNEGPVAQSVQPAGPVAAVETPNLLIKVILFPAAVSMLIFLLLWSVLNGWFERLIF
ncbi:MAG: hypothetical protein AAF456_04885 [Planctomycetota bacterium]